MIVARKLLGTFGPVRAEEETAGVLSEAYFRLHSIARRSETAVGAASSWGLAAAPEIRRVLLDEDPADARSATKQPRPKAAVSIDARPDRGR